MRCQDIRSILTEGADARPDGGPAADLERHLAVCPACAAFQTDLAKIRIHFQAGTQPVLPATLDRRVRAAWRAELVALIAATHGEAAKARQDVWRTNEDDAFRPEPLPRWVWGALGVLTALTAVFVYPLFAASEIVEPLSFSTAARIALLLQNGMMLFLAPILFRKFKLRPGASRLES